MQDVRRRIHKPVNPTNRKFFNPVGRAHQGTQHGTAGGVVSEKLAKIE